MKIEKLEHDADDDIVYERFLLTEIESFAQLIAAYDTLAKEHPSASLLMSLDDLAQAQYTSMHASMKHKLDGPDVAANFKVKAASVSFANACARGLTLPDDELAALEAIHADPLHFLDTRVILWVVPVNEPALALSAFPNGYFTCDLDPFENYALARHLADNFHYRLFAIGASCIAFKRDTALHAERAQALACDIASLYNCSQDRATCDRLANMVAGSKLLFLKYAETLEI